MAVSQQRLTGLDASFLHLENGTAHMHVGAVMTFDGAPPEYGELLDAIDARLHLVPRYRQRLAQVPLGQGRPRWVDDPHFNLEYHVRRTALAPPGSEPQLRALAGRVFSQRLDRDKPLWELWLVEGLEGDGFAVVSKTHHALVDGISGVDIMSVLFDTEPDAAPPARRRSRWLPRPLPSSTQLLAEALLERATMPAEMVRGARALARAPRRLIEAGRSALVGVGALAWAGLKPAPHTPYNVPIGTHRRFAWQRVALRDVKAIKDSLGGTVNDVVLATVTGALRRHLGRRGVDTSDLELKAMVPVSVRAPEARGALGNQVAAMMAPLPIWSEDPVTRFDLIRAAMESLKRGGQAVGAHVLTELAGFAPPTIMSQAARVAARQRFFNVVVTNVPGPQQPLYLAGHELVDIFPLVPLAPGQALGIAIMSYNGRLNFGLLGDYDALADLDRLAGDLRASLAELADAAGVTLRTPPRRGRRQPSRNGRRSRRPAAAEPTS